VKSGKTPSASEYWAIDPIGMTKNTINQSRPGIVRR
jgi:hypothetical protein